MHTYLYRGGPVSLVCALVFSIIAAIFIFRGSQSREVQENAMGRHMEDSSPQALKTDFGEFPLAFEFNAGQTDKRVEFLSRGPGFTIFLTKTEAVLSLRSDESLNADGVLSLRLDGANPSPDISGENRIEGRTNYFAGNDPSKWKTNIPNFSRVQYKNVYPGISQVFYGNGQQLEYDFVVEPKANFREISISFSGADDIEISPEGDLLLTIGEKKVVQKRPLVFQDIDGTRKEVAANYSLHYRRTNGVPSVGFEIGEYDHSRPLVIDPVLTYSTYLGGTGFDQGYAVAVDSAGNAYLTGRTGTANFPTTEGAFDRTLNTSNDAFVTKINAAGNALVYSTYIGGAIGNGITVDSQGNAYVTGEAGSLVFPTTPGAFQTSPFGFDAFILKLNPTGSALVYSSRFGGGFDDFARDITIDSSGNAYITGWTVCLAPTCTFPTVNAFQPNYGGGNNDAFVSKLNASGSALVYSTYLGGGEILNATDDWGEGIAIDSSGNAYVTGYTYSPDFPVTSGAYDTSRCGLDAFITKFAPNGGSLVYSTFLGGCAREQGMSIDVDSAGSAFVTGITESTNFPTTAGAFQTTGSFDAFVTKLNPAGNGLIYSTYLGGNEDVDRGWSIAIDNAGNAYVSGDTKSTDFPVANAIQANYGGGLIDAFVSKLNPTGTALVYSTYLGGNQFDEGRGIAVDSSGSAYITGDTSSNNFPVTAGAFQTQNAGGLEHHDDAFVVKIQGEQIQPRRPVFDFDGDGKTDISVFRPNAGNAEWWISRSSNTGVFATAFGVATDVPVPGDFTGDGKTDIAIFRPASGQWFVLRSEDLSFLAFPFGQNGDVPVPADYDNDGKDDAAVFRGGTWFISQSGGGGVLITGFGVPGDQPVPADYDNDGKADIAVTRTNGGMKEWWIQRSSAGLMATVFGAPTDRAVPGDYTGDGKTDIAVWRSSNSTWFILRSENFSFFAFPFGQPGDIPIPGEYDGDGKFDAGVFRPGVATWFVSRSGGAGTLIVGFGTSTDTPVPSAYVR